MAEGRNIDRDDTALDAAAKMPAITCHLKVDDISGLLNAYSEDKEMGPTEDSGSQLQESVIHPRVQEAVRVVNKLLSNNLGMRDSDASTQKHAACTLHRCLEETIDEKSVLPALESSRAARIDLYRYDWGTAYTEWRAKLKSSEKHTM